MTSKDIYDALDREITSAYEHYLKLKLRRNELAPVSCLPPEVLSAIFITYARMLESGDVRRQLKLDPYQWILVTHVCKRWREVALNTAQLWAVLRYHPRRKYEVMKAFISRSREVPLELEIQQEDLGKLAELEKLTGALSLVLPELGRTRTLALSMAAEAFRILEDKKKIPAVLPLLRSLSLISDAISLDRIVPLPSFVTQSCTPNLTSLHANNLLVSWVPGLLPRSLRSLDIRSVYLVPLSQIVTVISELPLLEQLGLFGLFQPLSDEPAAFASSFPEVRAPRLLPHLQGLFLDGPALAIFHFFNFFDLPAWEEIELLVTDDCNVDIASVLASSLIPKITCHGQTKDTSRFFHRLSVADDMLGIKTRSGSTDVPTTSASDFGLCQLLVEFDSYPSPNNLLPWAIAAHLPLEEVSQFALCNGVGEGENSRPWFAIPNIWATMLLGMTNVSMVLVLGSMCPEETRILHAVFAGFAEVEPDDAPERSSIPLPKVTHLLLDSDSFKKSRGPSLQEGTSAFVKDIRWLVEFCAAQPERSNMQQLIVENSSSMDQEDVAALEMLLTVVWE